MFLIKKKKIVMKIGTHDSATGEKSYGFLSFLGIPFSKTQSKTIHEQYEANCRYFDIRVRKTKRGWICAHGLWQCKRLAEDILEQINSYKDCYVQLVYEGYGDKEYSQKVEEWFNKYKSIKFQGAYIKYPSWRCVKSGEYVKTKNCFIELNFQSLHTLLPIPWLWKKIYFNKPKFNDEFYSIVDFL